MTYNFDEIIDRRHTNSENVDGWRPYIFHCGPERVFPYKDEEFVRMWVADMEFAVAPEIRQAIIDRVNRQILGYSIVSDDGYYQALRRRHPGPVSACGGPGKARRRQGADHDPGLRLLPPCLRV